MPLEIIRNDIIQVHADAIAPCVRIVVVQEPEIYI